MKGRPTQKKTTQQKHSLRKQFRSKEAEEFAQTVFVWVGPFSQRQSITQKGVHAHALTAPEREHWFLQHLSHFLAADFGHQ